MFRFKTLFMLLAAVLFTASSTSADEIHVISPSPWADLEANAGTQAAMPYARIQQVFAAEDFKDLPAGNSAITSIIQRSDGSFNGSGEWTATRYWVRMCTTDKPVGGLDFVFENNWGDDLTTVLDGPVAVSQTHSGPPGGPNEFDEPIALQHPFIYDPSEGNLLVDYQQHNLIATGTVSWDFVHDSTQTSTQAIWGGVADSSAASSSGGLVWQFTVVTPVLEADFDEDGDVDGDDFLLWQSRFPLASGAVKGDGDYDNDGDVDGDDFLGWQAEFPSPGSGVGSSAVPEPAAIFLAILLGIGAVMLRVRS